MSDPVSAALTQLVSSGAAPTGDQSLIVPSYARWQVHMVSARLVTSATVGNRNLVLQVLDDAGNLVYLLRGGIVQAASLTRDYQWAPGHPQEVAFTNNLILREMSAGLYLLPEWRLRVFDESAIAAATDVATVRAVASVF